MSRSPTTCMVELLYEVAPKIDGSALLGELRKRCGKVDLLGHKDKALLYAFPDHTIEYRDGRAPAQVLLGYPNEGEVPLNLEQALQQTRGWPEVRQVVATCRAPLLLTEWMAQRLERRVRLSLFQDALESVLEVAPCKAIHLAVTQQLVNPGAFLESRKTGDYHPLQFALNVRSYRISNGQPGEMLVDTLGMAVFGLPDLQCNFVGLDENKVANVVYNTAFYIFDKGDVIQDGHTIQGIAPNDKWKCQHEVSCAEPKREVLDVNPGLPYAAGKRK